MRVAPFVLFGAVALASVAAAVVPVSNPDPASFEVSAWTVGLDGIQVPLINDLFDETTLPAAQEEPAPVLVQFH